MSEKMCYCVLDTLNYRYPVKLPKSEKLTPEIVDKILRPGTFQPIEIEFIGNDNPKDSNGRSFKCSLKILEKNTTPSVQFPGKYEF